MKYFCPVCGFKGLDENPEGLTLGFLGSFEICPCCGTEFGSDVYRGILGGVENSIHELRRKWIKAGFPWFDDKFVKKPKDWDPVKQLTNIGVKLKKTK